MFAYKKVYLGNGRFFSIAKDEAFDPLDVDRFGTLVVRTDKGLTGDARLSDFDLAKRVQKAVENGDIVIPVAGFVDGNGVTLYPDESLGYDVFSDRLLGFYISSTSSDLVKTVRDIMVKEITDIQNFYRFGAYQYQVTEFNYQTGEFDVMNECGGFVYNGINADLIRNMCEYIDLPLEQEMQVVNGLL